MPKVKIGKKDYEVDSEVAELIKKQDEAISDAQTEAEKLQGKVDALKEVTLDAKRKMSKKAKAEEEDDEDEEMEDSDPDDDEDEEESKGKKGKKSKSKDKKKDTKMDSFDRKDALELGRQLANLEVMGKKVLGSDFKADGLDIAEMQRKILAKSMPSLKLESRSDEYVAASFDVFSENYQDPNAKKLRAGIGKNDSQVIRGAHHHDSIIDPIQFKQDAMDRYEKRWTIPLEKLTIDSARHGMSGMSSEDMFAGIAKYITQGMN